MTDGLLFGMIIYGESCIFKWLYNVNKIQGKATKNSYRNITTFLIISKLLLDISSLIKYCIIYLPSGKDEGSSSFIVKKTSLFLWKDISSSIWIFSLLLINL